MSVLITLLCFTIIERFPMMHCSLELPYDFFLIPTETGCWLREQFFDVSVVIIGCQMLGAVLIRILSVSLLVIAIPLCSGMPKRIKNAKIALLDLSLQKAKMALGVQVVVTDPEKLESIRQR